MHYWDAWGEWLVVHKNETGQIGCSTAEKKWSKKQIEHIFSILCKKVMLYIYTTQHIYIAVPGEKILPDKYLRKKIKRKKIFP